MTTPPALQVDTDLARSSAIRRRVDPALLLLSATAASTDALSYLGLGHVFPANMTGNTVLLGVGLAGPDRSSAARSAVALGGFAFGVVVVTLLSRLRAVAARGVAMLLGAEWAAVLAAAIWWCAVGDHPRGATRFGLIVLVSVAMGAQSAVISQLDVGVTTTYITGTWVAAFVTWCGRSSDDDSGETQPRRLGVLACYLGAAIVSGLLWKLFGASALFFAVVLLAAALALRPVRS